jgi:hypothetical protein
MFPYFFWYHALSYYDYKNIRYSFRSKKRRNYSSPILAVTHYLCKRKMSKLATMFAQVFLKVNYYTMSHQQRISVTGTRFRRVLAFVWIVPRKTIDQINRVLRVTGGCVVHSPVISSQLVKFKNMTDTSFFNVLEAILKTPEATTKGLGESSTTTIRTTLGLVFQHVIDPETDGGDPALRDELQNIHDGGETIDVTHPTSPTPRLRVMC